MFIKSKAQVTYASAKGQGARGTAALSLLQQLGPERSFAVALGDASSSCRLSSREAESKRSLRIYVVCGKVFQVLLKQQSKYNTCHLGECKYLHVNTYVFVHVHTNKRTHTRTQYIYDALFTLCQFSSDP